VLRAAGRLIGAPLNWMEFGFGPTRVDLEPAPEGEGRPDHFDQRIDEIDGPVRRDRPDADQDEPPRRGTRP
jgi:hypothetical protein